jgi:biopolymer transport protein TolR
MSMSTGSSDGKSVSSEINVTPLIDVLLVLLIIFLVVMPIMMKMETLEVPRKIEDNEMPDPNASMITVRVLFNGQMVFDDNGKETTIMPADLLRTIKPKLENMKAGNEKVVFVDFEEAVPWGEVINTMDTIRSLATDENHDEIKVALKIREDKPQQ